MTSSVLRSTAMGVSLLALAAVAGCGRPSQEAYGAGEPAYEVTQGPPPALAGGTYEPPAVDSPGYAESIARGYEAAGGTASYPPADGYVYPKLHAEASPPQAYQPAQPSYEPVPQYQPSAPSYEPAPQAYEPAAPVYEPAPPAYAPPVEAYAGGETVSQPAYAPLAYQPAQPAYAPSGYNTRITANAPIPNPPEGYRARPSRPAYRPAKPSYAPKPSRPAYAQAPAKAYAPAKPTPPRVAYNEPRPTPKPTPGYPTPAKPAAPYVAGVKPAQQGQIAQAPAVGKPAVAPSKEQRMLDLLGLAAASEVAKNARLSAPASMNVGETSRVTLTLPAGLYGRLRSEAGKVNMRREAATASAVAALSGEGYRVSPEGPTAMPLKADAPTSFTWLVTPTADARGPLTAEVGADLTGGAGQPRSVSLGAVQSGVVAVALAEPQGSGFRPMDVLRIPGMPTVNLPGLGETPSSTITLGLLLLLLVVVLAAASRQAQARRERTERRRRYSLMTDYGPPASDPRPAE